MMKKPFLTLCTLMLCITAHAQRNGYDRSLEVRDAYPGMALPHSSRGYEKSLEVKGAVGLDYMTDYAFGISMNNGYRFSPYLYTGVGIGYLYLNGLYYHSFNSVGRYALATSYDSKTIQNLIQLFARIKINFTSAKVSPFASLDLGYSFNTEGSELKNANGLFFEPAIGCDFKLGPKQTLYVMLGYTSQHYEYESFFGSNYDAYHTHEKESARSFNLHVGFIF